MNVEQAIEEIVTREWQPEWRAGVEHYAVGYAVGQHVAYAITEHPDEPEPWEPDALLAFVPATGHGVTIIPCTLVDGDWYAQGEAIRVLCAMTGPMKLPVPYDLSNQSRAALDTIRDSVHEWRPEDMGDEQR